MIDLLVGLHSRFFRNRFLGGVQTSAREEPQKGKGWTSIVACVAYGIVLPGWLQRSPREETQKYLVAPLPRSARPSFPSKRRRGVGIDAIGNLSAAPTIIFYKRGRIGSTLSRHVAYASFSALQVCCIIRALWSHRFSPEQRTAPKKQRRRLSRGLFVCGGMGHM